MATMIFTGGNTLSKAVERLFLSILIILDLHALNNSSKRHHGHLRTILTRRIFMKTTISLTISLQHQVFTPAPNTEQEHVSHAQLSEHLPVDV